MAGTFVTLMWKHFTVRKRRYKNTLAEWFFPVMWFLALFILWECLSPQPIFSQSDVTNVCIEKSVPLAGKEGIITPMIMYTPDNEITRTLMDAAGKKLNLPRLNSFSVSKDHKKGYYGITNDSELNDFLAHIEINEAIIIFKDYGDKIPRKLDYTIRLKVDQITNIFQTFGKVSPELYRYPQMYSPFMQIQWTIDSSYIELKSGKTLNMTVYTQKFPYDDWKPNDMGSIICLLLQLTCSLALIVPFVVLAMRLMEERATGVQELLKMVGVSSNTLSVSHLLNAAPTGLVFSVGVALLLSATPIVNSSTLLIALMLALYYFNTVGAAFVCSFISTGLNHPTWLAMFEYVMLWIPVHLMMTMTDVPLSKTLIILTGLLFPHMPMYWFWNEVSTMEQYGKTLDFTTIWAQHNDQNAPVAQCYAMMVMQFFLMSVLVFYLSLVRVGAYGVALPWNFFLQKHNHCKKVKSDKLIDTAEENPIARDPAPGGEPLPRADVGIGIDNVFKVFGKKRALYNWSLDVSTGEITVLIGYYGAGKTTLIAIMTGMINATEGKMFLNSSDATDEIDLYPENNLFFPHLTVIEHVMFFSLLKGVPFAEARKSSQLRLDQLRVGYKASSATDDLSGGMKKRLQLACTLAGSSNILVLDETTSVLGVEEHRKLCDLLLTLRGERTVQLTTHDMEEADALGDRVAALHAGQLRCHDTPMDLKKNIGTGYCLSLTTTGVPNEQAITSVVKFQVPDATLKDKSLNSISYNLPASSRDRLPQLFTMLEAKRSELAVVSFETFSSTLEEVLLRLCSDDHTVLDVDTDDVLTEEHVKLVGLALCIHQMIVLMKRLSRSIMMCVRVALPILYLVSLIYVVNEKRGSDMQSSDIISLDLNLYKDNTPYRRVLYNLDDKSYLRKIRDHNPEVYFLMTSNITEAALREANEDLLSYSKYLAGIEVNDTSVKILYTTKVDHAAPVAMNILSNVLATRAGLDDDIIIHNHPATSFTYIPHYILK